MSNESENEKNKERISMTTVVVVTPETESELGPEGTFQVYTVGMKENYDMPDLEIRGVPHMFTTTSAGFVNEINAYRLDSEKPVEVGDTMSWEGEVIKVTQGDDWDGRYQWKAEDMLRLSSYYTDITHCQSCEGPHEEE
jgi:hypothetical protein